MTVNPVFMSYAKAEVATTNVDFVNGRADAIYIAATITTNALTLTLPDGGTVAVGLAPVGTVIPISCTKAVFAGGPAGAVIALKVP